VSLPLMGIAEVSSKLSSNFYNMEATASAGRELDEKPSYSAKIEVIGTSPIDLLSFKVDGTYDLYLQLYSIFTYHVL